MSAAVAYAAYELACAYSSRAEMERDLARAAERLDRATARWLSAYDRRHLLPLRAIQQANREREAAYYTWVALQEAVLHGL